MHFFGGNSGLLRYKLHGKIHSWSIQFYEFQGAQVIALFTHVKMCTTSQCPPKFQHAALSASNCPPHLRLLATAFGRFRLCGFALWRRSYKWNHGVCSRLSLAFFSRRMLCSSPMLCCVSSLLLLTVTAFNYSNVPQLIHQLKDT